MSEITPITVAYGDGIGPEIMQAVLHILMKAEAEKAEGQEDLVKTLGEVKAKNPEAIKKMSDIAKLYQDPESNKDKIAEIEKQLGGAEEAK